MKHDRRVGLLEIGRAMIIILIIFTLFDPQRVEKLQSARKSQIICLVDRSDSMQTEDIVLENRKPINREQWSEEFLKEDWVPTLETNATLLVKTFSSLKGTKETDITTAITDALDTSEELKAVLLLTDGDANTGNSILSVAGRSRALSVPIYSIITGAESSLPDLSLDDAFAPSFVLQEERVTISWQATNSFKSPRNSMITLLANGKKVDERPVYFNRGETISGNISWLPEQSGEVDFQILLNKIEGETYANNNQKNLRTRVEEKIIKALIIDSYPRWEYRFLRNALSRDPGVDLSCILFHPNMSPSIGEDYIGEFPKNKALLAPYDVVFIGDVGVGENELTSEQSELLADLIQYQASGIIFMPGRRGRQLSFEKTPLQELLPVIYDPEKPRGLGTQNPASFVLTHRGNEHWLTNLRGSGEKNRDFWSRLPGFHWSAMIQKSRPGSEVLAVHSNFVTEWGKMPILVIRRVGAGKSLYLGSDSAWRWRRGVEDKYHYRFWSQVVRWMAHGRYVAEKDGIKLIPSPEKPRLGEKVMLRCIILDKNGFPLENGEVKGFAKHPDGSVENLSFKPDPECPGVYLSSLQSSEAGNLYLEAGCTSAERSIQTTLRIEESNREKLGRPAISGPLSQLARLTGGSSKGHEDAKELIDRLSILPQPKPTVKIHRLRTNLNWGIFLFTLLAIYWTGRKFFGMV